MWRLAPVTNAAERSLRSDPPYRSGSYRFFDLITEPPRRAPVIIVPMNDDVAFRFSYYRQVAFLPNRSFRG
jgi:hypothetical protein